VAGFFLAARACSGVAMASAGGALGTDTAGSAVIALVLDGIVTV
jgi:hypothetical protein